MITFYVLIGWRELSSQSKRALYAYCKESVADRICHISKLAHDTYAKFLSGQCVEVMILGTLIFLSLSVAGIPYAGLTAVLTAAFAFVPYIGAFLSCAFGIYLLYWRLRTRRSYASSSIRQLSLLKSVHLSARRGKQCRAIPILDVVGGFAGR